MEVIDIPGRSGRCQLVLGSDGATLVDAGSDPQAKGILAVFDAIGLPVTDLRRIVLTHGDGDHTAGARLLQDRSGAEVIAHELEVEYVGGRVPASFPIAKRLFGLLGARLARPRVTAVVSGAGERYGELELVHAPGHTPGHLVVFAGRSLIAGDAFRTGPSFGEVPAALTVDRGRSRATIRSLADREIDRAYSGHGPPADDAGARLRSLAERLLRDRDRNRT